MHYTIERLMNGDPSVVDSYMAAKAHWQGIFQNLEEISVADLAREISNEQYWFENHCGGRWPGQEVMAYTAFATIYTVQSGWNGNEHLGQKIAAAFAASHCSVEVKGAAREAARACGR